MIEHFNRPVKYQLTVAGNVELEFRSSIFIVDSKVTLHGICIVGQFPALIKGSVEINGVCQSGTSCICYHILQVGLCVGNGCV